MTYVDEKLKQAKNLVGRRIEIPVHYDKWMQGARTGTVSSVGKDGAYINVKMDNLYVKRRVKVWRIDFDYIRVL